MAKAIQYVDFEGLKTFLSNLKTQYSKNLNSTDYIVQQAQIATYDAINDKPINEKYLTLDAFPTKVGDVTIAGTTIANVSTKADMLKAINVEDGAEVNIIETVKVKTDEETSSELTVTDKAVEIDLSPYAKKVDVTAVLQFQGVVDYVSTTADEDDTSSDSPVENAKYLSEITGMKVGDVYIVKYRSNKGTNELNAEFVYVESPSAHWEQFGSTGDFANYFTKEEVLAITSPLTKRVAANETAISANNQKIGQLESTISTNTTNITTNASDIKTIKENNIPTAEREAISSAKTYTDTEIGKIKYDVTDTANGFVETVTQTDGKIEVSHKAFDVTITEGTNAPTSGAVIKYVTEKFATTIGDLSYTDDKTGWVSNVSQTDGIIAVTHDTFDTAIDTSSTSKNPPTTQAVAEFGKTCMVYDSEESTKIQITSMTPVTTESINGMFTTTSST